MNRIKTAERAFPQPETLRAWLETRPESVRLLAEEFKPGAIFETDAGESFLVGWTEDDHLVLSPVDPFDDYDASMALSFHACASHFR